MTWVTKITHMVEPHLFVDEQRFEPHSFWHHQHHFQKIEMGIEMQDIVNYALPLGPFGRLANVMLIQKQLRRIFNFRRQLLEHMFGTLP